MRTLLQIACLILATTYLVDEANASGGPMTLTQKREARNRKASKAFTDSRVGLQGYSPVKEQHQQSYTYKSRKDIEESDLIKAVNIRDQINKYIDEGTTAGQIVKDLHDKGIKKIETDEYIFTLKTNEGTLVSFTADPKKPDVPAQIFESAEAVKSILEQYFNGDIK